MYRVFEHTADLGLRIEASTLDELFAEAAKGLCSLIVENVDDVAPLVTHAFTLEGSDREYLLFDWLNELLFVFETEHLLLSRCAVKVSSAGLTAVGHGEKLDPDRHRLDHEVKAITYHGLQLAESPAGGWWAEVIVDI